MIELEDEDISGEYDFNCDWTIRYFWDIDQVEMIRKHLLSPFNID